MGDDLVLDAGVGIRILLEDQPGHAQARDAFGAALKRGRRVLAPQLYLFEVGNVLARAQGKAERRAAALDAAHALVDVADLQPASFHRALSVAADGKLTFYDAAYLALAEQQGGVLWTEDREILKRFPARTADTQELLNRLAKE
ncbi:MAG TPA: type II toxin-antitoxin system VapC family toxin [Candidatus Thermoplasmatota archaeon]|nr:type II toxin-antitoxin system VapC family toxin [Candidatus Thermoplasmatota archaeon]